MLTPEEHAELQRLRREHIPLKAIARRLNRDVKTIRRALGHASASPPAAPLPSKLAPYHALITERFQKGLRSPRILREIREHGYTGGASILKTFLKTLSPPAPPTPTVSRRFETRPGEEAQSDWSPYRVVIAQRETIVHAFSLILCFCRRLFIAFFRDERLPTLLWAHQEAFRYHGGLCRRIAYDNQTAITLGRVGGKPRWHPTLPCLCPALWVRAVRRAARAQRTAGQSGAPLPLPRTRLPRRPRLRLLGRSPRPVPTVARHRRQRPGARHHPPPDR